MSLLFLIALSKVELWPFKHNHLSYRIKVGALPRVHPNRSCDVQLTPVSMLGTTFA